MVCIAAAEPCEFIDIMKDDSITPSDSITTSSNPNDSPNVRPDQPGSWSPSTDDTNPKVTVTVSDEDTPLDNITVTTSGVDTITVTVKDVNGNTVGTPTTITDPNPEETVTFPPGTEGTTVVITLTPTGTTEDIVVDEVTVFACVHPGTTTVTTPGTSKSLLTRCHRLPN